MHPTPSRPSAPTDWEPPPAAAGADARPERRLTDADRERAGATLRAAVGSGALDLGEFEVRLDVVYAATIPSDLAGVLDDLEPAPVAATLTAPVDQRRAHPPAMAGVLAIAAVVALGVLVTPQLLWLLWLAIPFAKGRFRQGSADRWPGGRGAHSATSRWFCATAPRRS